VQRRAYGNVDLPGFVASWPDNKKRSNMLSYKLLPGTGLIGWFREIG